MSRTLDAPAVPPAQKAGSRAASSVRRQPLPHFDTEGYGSVEAANEANSRADILEAVMIGAALRARTEGSEKLVRRLASLTLAVPPFTEIARHLATGASTEARRTAVPGAAAWAAVDEALLSRQPSKPSPPGGKARRGELGRSFRLVCSTNSPGRSPSSAQDGVRHSVTSYSPSQS